MYNGSGRSNSPNCPLIHSNQFFCSKSTTTPLSANMPRECEPHHNAAASECVRTCAVLQRFGKTESNSMISLKHAVVERAAALAASDDDAEKRVPHADASHSKHRKLQSRVHSAIISRQAGSDGSSDGSSGESHKAPAPIASRVYARAAHLRQATATAARWVPVVDVVVVLHLQNIAHTTHRISSLDHRRPHFSSE